LSAISFAVLMLHVLLAIKTNLEGVLMDSVIA
jgi:hypothetical protein